VDAVERLSLEEAGGPTLLAVTHVHRYELAAELCAGMRVLDLCCGSGYGTRILAGSAAAVTGVDNHEASIERARADLDGEGVAFERGDADEWLARALADNFDAIVLLEGLEHLADAAAALERLRRHAEAGLTLVVSLPNSRPFGEDNPHHVSEFDAESALAAFERLPNVRLLYQFHAEGSLIRVEAGDELDGRVTLSERADVEHCNHFLAVVNADAALSSLAASARMQLAVAPSFNRYILDLERENKALWRTNERLARDTGGIADSAAAAALTQQQDELPAHLEPVAEVATRVAMGLGTRVANRLWIVVLSILPHALTLLVLRIRARLRLYRSEDPSA
jgi:SAM-dependent methyltransferase